MDQETFKCIGVFVNVKTNYIQIFGTDVIPVSKEAMGKTEREN